MQGLSDTFSGGRLACHEILDLLALKCKQPVCHIIFVSSVPLLASEGARSIEPVLSCGCAETEHVTWQIQPRKEHFAQHLE